MYKKIISIIVIIILVVFLSITLQKKSNFDKKVEVEEQVLDTKTYSSNVIENVEYTSRDANGNEYIITARKGEVDISNNNIIFLEKVNGIIKLNNKNQITISSDYGKYNINNFDTIFSKNVLINYLNNKITGEYLDFSINRSTMIMSKKIVYSNLNDTIEDDVKEINIKNKDTKIFMYNKNNKVSLKKIN